MSEAPLQYFAFRVSGFGCRLRASGENRAAGRDELQREWFGVCLSFSLSIYLSVYLSVSVSRFGFPVSGWDLGPAERIEQQDEMNCSANVPFTSEFPVT